MYPSGASRPAAENTEADEEGDGDEDEQEKGS
jgi:hypothetical protein